jgi:hypothetical protein
MDSLTDSPLQQFTFHFPEPVEKGTAEAFEKLIAGLATARTWTVAAPSIFKERDEVIGELLGGSLDIHSATGHVKLPKEVDAREFEDVHLLVQALQRLSREQHVDIHFYLGDTFVGTIQHGELDKMLKEGLIGEWQRALGKA